MRIVATLKRGILHSLSPMGVGWLVVTTSAGTPPLLARQASLPQVAFSESVVPRSLATMPALAFENVTVIDVTDGTLLPAQTVVVMERRIQAVGPAAHIRIPRDAQVIDARGKYLIPGLWDMHPHLEHPGRGNSSNRYPPFYDTFIAHGVTGIRWMAQRGRMSVDSFDVWQREVAMGQRVGPRVLGPSFDLSDNLGRVRVGSPEDARRIVDSLKKAGMAFIKYHEDKGDPALYFALMREARRAGLPVVGHVPVVLSGAQVADSGQHSVEHANETPGCLGALRDAIDVEEKCGHAAEAYVRNGTWLTPTLVTFFYYRFPKDKLAIIRKYVPTMRRYGVTRFLTGTDTGPSNWGGRGIRPGFSVLEELVLLVEVGLTPLEALQAATLNPAASFQATDSLGTVAPGKLADLVLLDANPLADIRNVMALRAVVANGRYFDRAALDVLAPDARTWAQRFAEQPTDLGLEAHAPPAR